MITVYAGLKEGDKVTTASNVVYIIKRVKNRKSIVTNHFEILLRRQND
jgi:preprotein translocase subunit YajC